MSALFSVVTDPKVGDWCESLVLLSGAEVISVTKLAPVESGKKSFVVLSEGGAAVTDEREVSVEEGTVEPSVAPEVDAEIVDSCTAPLFVGADGEVDTVPCEERSTFPLVLEWDDVVTLVLLGVVTLGVVLATDDDAWESRVVPSGSGIDRVTSVALVVPGTALVLVGAIDSVLLVK